MGVPFRPNLQEDIAVLGDDLHRVLSDQQHEILRSMVSGDHGDCSLFTLLGTEISHLIRLRATTPRQHVDMVFTDQRSGMLTMIHRYKIEMIDLQNRLQPLWHDAAFENDPYAVNAVAKLDEAFGKMLERLNSFQQEHPLPAPASHADYFPFRKGLLYLLFPSEPLCTPSSLSPRARISPR